MKFYCKFRDYFFNPECYNPITGAYRSVDKDGRPQLDIKRGGTEYFTIGTSDYYDIHTMPDMFNEIEPLPSVEDLPE